MCFQSSESRNDNTDIEAPVRPSTYRRSAISFIDVNVLTLLIRGDRAKKANENSRFSSVAIKKNSSPSVANKPRNTRISFAVDAVTIANPIDQEDTSATDIRPSASNRFSESYDESRNVPSWRSQLPVFKEPFYTPGRALADEAVNRIKSYFGIIQDESLGLDWKLNINSKGVTVCGSLVNGTTWKAFKATSIMQVDKVNLLKILLDDTKTRLYQDMFDGATVRISF